MSSLGDNRMILLARPILFFSKTVGIHSLASQNRLVTVKIIVIRKENRENTRLGLDDRYEQNLTLFPKFHFHFLLRLPFFRYAQQTLLPPSPIHELHNASSLTSLGIEE
ncbi:hypothetical protein P8452_21502 [Trifolium repens]|nr:hypothetical protein P8452_21502 [Trifolium repens]